MTDPIDDAIPKIQAHPTYKWVRMVLLLVPFLCLDAAVYAGWAAGEYTLRPALIFWWLLLPPQLAILWGAIPNSLYPPDYAPSSRGRRDGRWTVVAPGVPYGCAFPGLAMAIAFVVTAATVVTANGRQWAVWEVAGMVAAGMAAAAVLGLLIRTAPRLDVDEERRELTWRPGSVAGRAVTLPFAAVVSVDVVGMDENRSAPEIVWRTGTGDVTALRLPAGATRERVEDVATSLRAALGLKASGPGRVAFRSARW